MARAPYGPYEGKMPEDQIRIPRPPLMSDPEHGALLRFEHQITALESYRRQIIRIWPDGKDSEPVDLVPSPGQTTDRPDDLFGGGCEVAFFLSGSHAFGRLTTMEDDAETWRRLRWRLDLEEEDWAHSVATSPDRQWVEKGALLKDFEQDEALSWGRFHGQAVILRWDSDGLTPLATREGVDVGGDEPVPVKLVTAATGCPLRCGADGPCKMWGGPWTSSSISAAYLWSAHRALLLDAFGCDVCAGEGGGGPIGGVDLFTPSREGGWQRGAPCMREGSTAMGGRRNAVQGR